MPQLVLPARSESTRDESTRCVTLFSCDLGWMAVATEGERVIRTLIGYPSRASVADAIHESIGVCREGRPNDDPLAARLQAFAAGEPVSFADVPIDFDYLTDFGRRISGNCRQIGYGQVRTYGELAAECGRPKAARAVGGVMAANRYPILVPCHRVVGAGRKLVGFSAPEGIRFKRRLLAMEGIEL